MEFSNFVDRFNIAGPGLSQTNASNYNQSLVNMLNLPAAALAAMSVNNSSSLAAFLNHTHQRNSTTPFFQQTHPLTQTPFSNPFTNPTIAAHLSAVAAFTASAAAKTKQNFNLDNNTLSPPSSASSSSSSSISSFSPKNEKTKSSILNKTNNLHITDVGKTVLKYCETKEDEFSDMAQKNKTKNNLNKNLKSENENDYNSDENDDEDDDEKRRRSRTNFTSWQLDQLEKAFWKATILMCL